MLGPYPQQPIPIEALSEYDVKEIQLDGREILEKPPTAVEHFQKILNHIDFTKTYDDSMKLDVNESGTGQSDNNNVKVWNSVREATRMALTEINAFVDILAVIKEEKYLSVFPTARDPPNSDLSLNLAGKKRALAAASDILLKGTERLCRRHSELADARLRATNSSSSAAGSSDRGKSAGLPDSYHKTLMQLRQEWRLRLHQNAILGDVSLRSIGSRFRESGNFEVREADLVAKQQTGKRGGADETDVVGGVEVVFSKSVEALLNSSSGCGIPIVRLHHTGFEAGPVCLWDLVFSNNSGEEASNGTGSKRLSQRERLSRTQRLLACREIIFTLACEASSTKGLAADAICFATQDKVIITLLPGVQVTIEMDTTPKQSTVRESGDIRQPVCKAKQPDGLMEQLPNSQTQGHLSRSDYTVSTLGLQLHRLLAARHRAAWPNLASIPPVASGPVQVPVQHRAAGARALPSSHFHPPNNGSPSQPLTFSIAVASVAGFSGPAASAWSTHNLANSGGGNTTGRSEAPISQRLPSTSITQDRLTLFTEWGGGGGGQSGGAPGVTNPFDDSVQGTVSVAAMEQLLIRRRADEGALQTVLGSGASMLDRTVAMCRHYYLREKVFKLLIDFSRQNEMRLICHWSTVNSALCTSVRVCFYAPNYDAYRPCIGLNITHSGITIHYPDTPRSCSVGMDLPRLQTLLKNQVIHTQMHYLDILITNILGWTRLGHNPGSGLASPEELGDGPVMVKMFASPSGRFLTCLRACGTTGLRLFLVNEPLAEVDEFHSDGARSFSRHFREVDLLSVRVGSHTVARIEAVLTSLSA